MKSCKVIAQNRQFFYLFCRISQLSWQILLVEKSVQQKKGAFYLDISLKLIFLDIRLKNQFLEMFLCARIFSLFHRFISIENQHLGMIRGVFSRNPGGIGIKFIEIIELDVYIRAY